MKKIIKTVALAIVMLSGVEAFAQNINTYAGTGSSSYSGDGAAATSAQINLPNGVATDRFGNLYIADQSNNRIRMVNTSGIISTIAGNGTSGFSGDGGSATAAELSNPIDVAVDSTGNIYIDDFNNQRIRKVNTSGIISTFAGNGTAGFSGDGGPAANAEFNSPQGIACSAQGVLYIADQANNVIRRVGTNGVITTFSGNPSNQNFTGDGGLAINATLNNPYRITVDKNGNVFILDQNQSVIRMVNTAGIINTIVGTPGTTGFSGDGLPATSAKINAMGICTDVLGNLYIADRGNQRVRIVNPSGIISTFAGNGTGGSAGDGGAAISANLYYPFGVATDLEGHLFIATRDSKIRVVGCFTPSISISGTHSSCSGNNVFLTGSGAITYTWSSNASNATTGSVMVSPASTTTYTLTGSIGSCTSTSTFSLNITSTPTININGNNLICSSVNTLLTGGGGATYTWSSNAGAAISSTVSVNPSTTTTYTLVGANGMCLDSATFMLNVISPPTPAICMVATDSTSNYQYNIVYWDNTQYPTADSFIVYRYCGGTYLRLGAVVKDSARFVDTYTSICGPGGGDPTVTSYKYVLALRDSCKNLSGQSQYHATTNVATNATNITWNDYLINGAAVAVGYDVYRDSLGNSNFYLYHQSAVSPLNVPSFSSYPNQAFRVDPVLSYTCNIVERLANPTNSPYATRVKSHSNTARQAGGQTTGINKVGSIGQVMVYPNPSNGTFNIQSANNNGLGAIEVYNTLGQLIYQSNTASSILPIDLSIQNPGIYTIKVQSSIYKVIRQ